MNQFVKTSLIVAGCISLLFLIFHIAFPWLFNWDKTLACLDRANWAILQTFNLGSILMVATMVFFSFRYRNELVHATLGRPILIVFALYYLIRIAAEFMFFGFAIPSSIIIIALCLIPALAYLLAAVVRPSEAGQGIEKIAR